MKGVRSSPTYFAATYGFLRQAKCIGYVKRDNLGELRN